jgi:4,5-DOPA dioxygenase extradiol
VTHRYGPRPRHRTDGRPEFRLAVPTPDHFLPLLYLAGLADAGHRTPEVLVDGYTFGSLSMTSYALDAMCPERPEINARAAGLPDPSVVPPDESNA